MRPSNFLLVASTVCAVPFDGFVESVPQDITLGMRYCDYEFEYATSNTIQIEDRQKGKQEASQIF